MTQRTDTYDTELLLAMLKSAATGKRIAHEGMREILDGGRDYEADDPEGLCEGLLDDARLLEKAIAALERQTPPASAQSVQPVGVACRVTYPSGKFALTNDFQWAAKRKAQGWRVDLLGVITTQPSAEGARDAALEEAASMCDSYARTKHNNGQSCAQAIRALKSKKEV